VMVTSTAMSATCLSSLVLGSFMCGLVVFCRRFGRDPGMCVFRDNPHLAHSIPDNIAPPIAACLGDLVTLCLLGLVSSILIYIINTPFPLVLTCLLVLSATACAGFTRRNESVKHLLGQGWPPLFGAMVISSGSGIVLDLFVSRYEGFALLAVVISGKSNLHLGLLLGSFDSQVFREVQALCLSRACRQRYMLQLPLPAPSRSHRDRETISPARAS
jgi:solute carrier family 41